MDRPKLIGALIAAILSTTAHASADRPFGLAMDQQVSQLDIARRDQRFVVLRSVPAPAAPFSRYVVAENARGEVCRVIGLAEFGSVADADASQAAIVERLSARYAQPELRTDAILHFDRGAALEWRPLGNCGRDDLATEADVKTCRISLGGGTASDVAKVTLLRRDLGKPMLAVRYDLANRDGCPADPAAKGPTDTTLKRRDMPVSR
ncbi:hypothetical protein [Rhodopseudomonas sp.]|uniref:hypothetical protein n=1 Tax=Rhodopseudomonas sp. TaxID=1078 RepID=UPI003B3B0452